MKNSYKFSKIISDGRKFVDHARLFGTGATVKKVLQHRQDILDSGVEIVPLKTQLPADSTGFINARNITISVIIPVKNGGEGLKLLLQKLREQEGFAAVEIIIVDSGSSDNSLLYATEFNARIFAVPSEEFSHSGSRNLGAENARGEFLLFMVQDALPTDKLWLKRLFTIMQTNNLTAVSCMENHHEDAGLFYQAITWNLYQFMEIESGDRVMQLPKQENHLTMRKNAQLTNVACLIGKEAFGKYLFRYEYGEDLDLGIRLIKDGHRIAMLNSVRVIHSHNRSAYYYLQRGYVDRIYCDKINPEPLTNVHSLEKLSAEITATYIHLQEIIETVLKAQSLPCPVSQLSRQFFRSFQSGLHKINLNGNITTEKNEYTDSAYSQFVKSLSQSVVNFPGSSDTEFIRGLQSYFMILFNYLNHTQKSIEKDTFAQLLPALFRTHAFYSGASLANCYISSKQNKNDVQQDLHRLLSQGV